MKWLLKLIGAVFAALFAFMHEKSAAASVRQREVDEYNAKIAKARAAAAAEFDARGGVPDPGDPNLRD